MITTKELRNKIIELDSLLIISQNKILRLIGSDFAESVLYIFENSIKSRVDNRPRKAIQASRDYSNNLIDLDELNDFHEMVLDCLVEYTGVYGIKSKEIVIRSIKSAYYASSPNFYSLIRVSDTALSAVWETDKKGSSEKRNRKSYELEKQKQIEIIKKYLQ